jgi:peptidoglycan/xylan/chitin deacetylase (PgdA/CDA1 family)
MAKQCSIVMYHYVGTPDKTRWSAIKGLRASQFIEQLQYVRKHYNVISAQDLLLAAEGNKELPPRALLLSFDDGYKDHYSTVFPILMENKLTGCFFPVAKTLCERTVLDVNKIHFVLASVQDPNVLIEAVFHQLDRFRGDYSLDSNESYFQRFAKPARYDPKEVVFIKSMLQRELPEELRTRIIGELFSQFVTADEAAFSQELYLAPPEIKEMIDGGMTFGLHGYSHSWMNTLDQKRQEREIVDSLRVLEPLGVNPLEWIMCYPYGANDDSLKSVLKRHHCKIGLCTEVRIAELGKDDIFALPRLDTNDLPKTCNAEPNSWFSAMLS